MGTSQHPLNLPPSTFHSRRTDGLTAEADEINKMKSQRLIQDEEDNVNNHMAKQRLKKAAHYTVQCLLLDLTPASPHIRKKMNPSSALIPIRIDVSSDDKSIRIVDTFLFDPTCWPIPLSVPLSVSVEENIQLMAYTVLSEAETNGMGRTVRHFTGRMELWSQTLQQKMEAQLRPQFWKMVDGHVPKIKTIKAISIRLVLHGVVIEEDFLWDPNVPFSVIDFAQDMAKELKLPEEAVVSIATSILEQTYGLAMDTSVDRSMILTPPMKGAWMIDSKEYVSTMAHIVAQHRPKKY
jgi:hypothetical protein